MAFLYKSKLFNGQFGMKIDNMKGFMEFVINRKAMEIKFPLSTLHEMTFII